jgi:hypothetical protein
VDPSSDRLGISPIGRCDRGDCHASADVPAQSAAEIEDRCEDPQDTGILARAITRIHRLARATIQASIVLEVVGVQSNQAEVPRICGCKAQIPESKDDARGHHKENSE